MVNLTSLVMATWPVVLVSYSPQFSLFRNYTALTIWLGYVNCVNIYTLCSSTPVFINFVRERCGDMPKLRGVIALNNSSEGLKA